MGWGEGDFRSQLCIGGGFRSEVGEEKGLELGKEGLGERGRRGRLIWVWEERVRN